jgi:tetratricopeptide (TPR) repeat protein
VIKRAPDGAAGSYVWQALIQLGYFDVANRLASPPAAYIPYIQANDPRAIQLIEKEMDPKRFWRFGMLAAVMARVCTVTNRLPWLAKMYHAAVSSPEEFEKVVGRDRMAIVAPGAAVALKQAGNSAEASKLLELAEDIANDADEKDPSNQVALARIYAVQGRTDNAVSLLSSAVRAGWLPPYLPIDTDLGRDPAFAQLGKDPRFQQIRQQILAKFARERSQVNIPQMRRLAGLPADQR